MVDGRLRHGALLPPSAALKLLLSRAIVVKS
jgi:hypothetical protein